MARERCTELCTRAATGRCTLCESLEKRDAFFAAFLHAWAWLTITITVLCVLLWALTWPFRRWWFRDAFLYVIGPTGYRAVVPAVATLIAAYVGAYAIVEAQHERQMNRALFEQNRFMTLAASGSPGGLNAALAEYQTLKAREVLKSPDIWRAWTWGETERVNEAALKRWTQRFFAGCPESWCGQGLYLMMLGKGDLVEADLRGASLQNAILPSANLQDADLEGANLQGANLRYANLQDADLEGANLQGADLRWANLQDVNLRYANLQDVNLRYANLQRAFLPNTNLQDIDLWEANLQDADLGFANLQRGFLPAANFQRADLGFANFQRANLRFANLQDADLEFANLQDADLEGANLQDADLEGANLQDAYLGYANLYNAIGLVSAQSHAALWDEYTEWDFTPLCRRHLPPERCAPLDRLSDGRFLLPAIAPATPTLADAVPERRHGIAGMLAAAVR